jgi:hypothetical protein
MVSVACSSQGMGRQEKLVVAKLASAEPVSRLPLRYERATPPGRNDKSSKDRGSVLPCRRTGHS